MTKNAIDPGKRNLFPVHLCKLIAQITDDCLSRRTTNSSHAFTHSKGMPSKDILVTVTAFIALCAWLAIKVAKGCGYPFPADRERGYLILHQSRWRLRPMLACWACSVSVSSRGSASSGESADANAIAMLCAGTPGPPATAKAVLFFGDGKQNPGILANGESGLSVMRDDGDLPDSRFIGDGNHLFGVMAKEMAKQYVAFTHIAGYLLGQPRRSPAGKPGDSAWSADNA